MNVLLASPPSPFLLDDRVVPSLGVLQVAASLRDHGHDVRVLDLAGYDQVRMLEETERVIRDQYDVFGITATSPQFPYAVDLLQVIREADPGKRVILGGPHATVDPDSCGMFDCVVLGDGEDAVIQALAPDAPKVIDAASTVKKGELKWRWPARDLIDMTSYKYRLGGRLGTSMLWSMGCPWGCLWCCGRLTPFLRRQRQRNVDDVVREAEHLVEAYGVGAVTAYDDEVNIQQEPLLELCGKLAPLGLKYRAFIKANLFTDQQAEAMAKAGFIEVCTGVESGSDRILGIMQKSTTFEINRRARETAQRYGLRFKAFCSIGHVGETEWDVMETKRWLLEVRPDDFDVTVITVYPGTPIYAKREFVGHDERGHRVVKYVHASKRPEQNGATLFFTEVDYSREFAWYKGKPNAYISHVWTPDLSKEDLVRLRDQVEGEVRRELRIPFPQRYSGDYLENQENYEHSFGAGVTPQDSRVVLKGGQ